MTSDRENKDDAEQEPAPLPSVSTGQSVTYQGKHAIVFSNHPFYGIRLQAPEGGPTWYAARLELKPFEEPEVPVAAVEKVDPGLAECRRWGCLRTEP